MTTASAELHAHRYGDNSRVLLRGWIALRCPVGTLRRRVATVLLSSIPSTTGVSHIFEEAVQAQSRLRPSRRQSRELITSKFLSLCCIGWDRFCQ